MRVLLVCSGGMSSAIVVHVLKQEAQKHDIKMKVMAVGSNAFAEEVKKGWDVALVAPQVRHRFDSLKQAADEAKVPCDVIPPEAYHPLGGPALLSKIKELIGKTP